MSQEFDLSGPACAEALRISDALIREAFGEVAPRDPKNPEAMQDLLLRVQSIAVLTESILRTLTLAVAETNQKMMNGRSPEA